jgi:hypothetical protein
MLSIRVSGTNKATLLRVYGGLPQDVAGGDGDAPDKRSARSRYQAQRNIPHVSLLEISNN